LKKPDLDGCYLTKRRQRDKRQTTRRRRILSPAIGRRPAAAVNMLDALKFDRIRKQARPIVLTLCMVAAPSFIS
jgi:hypothetical protein